jgi:hypothetical protein
MNMMVLLAMTYSIVAIVVETTVVVLIVGHAMLVNRAKKKEINKEGLV